jgi:hypothetical protein
MTGASAYALMRRRLDFSQRDVRLRLDQPAQGALGTSSGLATDAAFPVAAPVYELDCR